MKKQIKRKLKNAALFTAGTVAAVTGYRYSNPECRTLASENTLSSEIAAWGLAFYKSLPLNMIVGGGFFYLYGKLKDIKSDDMEERQNIIADIGDGYYGKHISTLELRDDPCLKRTFTVKGDRAFIFYKTNEGVISSLNGWVRKREEGMVCVNHELSDKIMQENNRLLSMDKRELNLLSSRAINAEDALVRYNAALEHTRQKAGRRR